MTNEESKKMEICTRIADIEGIDYFTSEGVVSYQNDLGMCREYNPLTDDALCFQLMVRYSVEIEFYPDGTVDARVTDLNISRVRKNITGQNANEAICLAIIEATK